jgi:hypothetical protein
MVHSRNIDARPTKEVTMRNTTIATIAAPRSFPDRWHVGKWRHELAIAAVGLLLWAVSILVLRASDARVLEMIAGEGMMFSDQSQTGD